MGLKELLGEALYNQAAAALKGKGEGGKDVELAIANNGSMVPVAKFNKLNDKYVNNILENSREPALRVPDSYYTL